MTQTSETTADESPDMHVPTRKVFEVLGASIADGCVARVGRLSIPGRRPIDTPNYTAITSRGAIPHLTPDNVTRHTNLTSAYMALEDCKLAVESRARQCPVKGSQTISR